MRLKGQVIYLSGSSWGPPGNHWYGRVTSKESDSIELRRELDDEAARLLNESQKGEPGAIAYKVGDLSGRYTTFGELVRSAVATMNQLYPDGEVLIDGETYVCDPQAVLRGPGERFVKAANKYWAEYEDAYEGTNDVVNDKKYKVARRKYKALFKRRGIKIW